MERNSRVSIIGRTRGGIWSLKSMCTMILFIAGLSVGFIGENAETGEERLRLVGGVDSLVRTIIDGKDVWELWNKVEMEQGEAKMICDRARWWRDEDKVSLMGRVVIDDGKRTLKANRVDYDGRLRRETATGRVSLESGDRRLFADRMVYDQNKQSATADGNVIMTDLIERATLQGDWGIYDRKSDHGVVEGSPRFTRVDSLSLERMIVDGLHMEAWGDSQRVVVTDSVRIVKGDFTASCERTEYLSETDLLILQESPVVRHRQQEMRGESIDIHLDEIQLRGGEIKGHAEIVSKDSTYEDVLSGEIIRFEVSEDTIRSVIIQGQATSIYHVLDEETQEQGVNTVTGDRIVLTFDGEKLARVRVESDPGQCTGQYKHKEGTKTSGDTGSDR